MNFPSSGIEGFDVSFYQDVDTTPQTIDFSKMALWGCDFVIVRAGQGFKVDPDFVTNWRTAREAGLPRASYWFYDPRVSPYEQARIFAGLFKDDKPEGRLWLDLEFPDSWGGSFVSWLNWKICIEEVERITGLRIGVYTANWWWYDHATQKGADYTYFGQYPLWVAQYDCNAEDVILPRGWSSAMIWQDSTPPIGKIVGVESEEIDHNKWNDDFDFATEWGSQPKEQEENEEPMSDWYKVNTAGLNMRNGPGAGYDKVGLLVLGDIIESTGITNGWHRINAVWHAGAFADVPVVAWCSGAYLVPATDPAPPDPEPVDEIFVSVNMDLVATFNDKPYHAVVAIDNIQMKPV